MAVETTEEETPAGGESTPEPSMMDAINAALEPAAPVVVPPTDEDDADELDEDEEGEEGEGTEEPGVTVDAQGRRHGPDGKLLPAVAKAGADAAAKPDAKLGADGKPLPIDDKGKKGPDPVNDPIPEDVKGRTRDRMQSLISTVKEKDEHIALQDQLRESISSTGATPQEFGAMLGYMRWVHSDKPEDLKQARELLMSELRGVSLKLGEAAPGIDFLEDHADLKAKVEAGQLTAEDAQELAINRTRQKSVADRTAADRARDEGAQADTKARTDAIADLNTLGKTLQSTDPEYTTKHDILQPVLASLGMLAPAQWKQAFTNAYKAITPEQVARFKALEAGGVAPVVKGPAPLRGNKTPTGGQEKKPQNLHDAMFGDGFPA